MSETNIVEVRKKNVTFRPVGNALMPMSYFSKESRSWFYSLGSYFMIIFFCIIAYLHLLFIWSLVSYYSHTTTNFTTSPLLLLARLEGQVAIFLFSIDFILAVRSNFIEKLFGGFDRVYKMHGIVGRVGFMSATLHFLFLIINSWDYAKELILPSSSYNLLFGQISFWLFVILILFTVWIKIPHHIWLWTHKAMGVAFMLSGFHMFLMQPLYKNFEVYRSFIALFWFIGMYSWLYKLLLYNLSAPSHKAIVTKVEQQGDVFHLYLKVIGDKFISRPGDFVWISLSKTRRHLLKEHHPFSISGLFEDNTIRLSVKDLGDFTHKLIDLKTDDTVTIFGPYGKFDDKLFTKKTNMIWIGGGIGVAPFLYMAQQFCNLPGSGKIGKRKAKLFYTVNGTKEALCVEELEKAAIDDADFTYKVWDAQNNGHLTAQAIVDSIGGIEELRKQMVFMCGPLPMMHAISKQLLELGMKPKNIIFEEFAFE